MPAYDIELVGHSEFQTVSELIALDLLSYAPVMALNPAVAFDVIQMVLASSGAEIRCEQPVERDKLVKLLLPTICAQSGGGLLDSIES
ncbi:hypothetical protein H257_08459 [Aphanomyces astaci]|uniref:Uncharacterized protein n=1 Tax=Aphanomyces astaci TaxID=112090 RepID=W4GCX0_APHAT|nr:hypothetical protein H257_08459 [Aphanomyces astaci]ETV77520.1 hypothetical protein H257_08459 [Aphanomyces astaci]|eukprot:XP_009832630.1 hypothetical protein H257_08459 [Aphanomyces astaci]